VSYVLLLTVLCPLCRPPPAGFIGLLGATLRATLNLPNTPDLSTSWHYHCCLNEMDVDVDEEGLTGNVLQNLHSHFHSQSPHHNLQGGMKFLASFVLLQRPYTITCMWFSPHTIICMIHTCTCNAHTPPTVCPTPSQKPPTQYHMHNLLMHPQRPHTISCMTYPHS
jgi:hypothetical protein